MLDALAARARNDKAADLGFRRGTIGGDLSMHLTEKDSRKAKADFIGGVRHVHAVLTTPLFRRQQVWFR